MGLFRDLGRRAEKLKTQATDAAEAQAEFGCTDCGKAIFTDRETCPSCGSEAVARRTEPTDDTGHTDDAEDAADT